MDHKNGISDVLMKLSNTHQSYTGEGNDFMSLRKFFHS